jgi:hypothetical protein
MDGSGEKTRLILPGQRGTKRLTDKYGDELVCVRFRYDSTIRMSEKNGIRRSVFGMLDTATLLELNWKSIYI